MGRPFLVSVVKCCLHQHELGFASVSSSDVGCAVDGQ